MLKEVHVACAVGIISTGEENAKQGGGMGPSSTILVPRAYDTSGLWLGSRALVWSNTGSPWFMHFPSNPANLIGWQCETNALRMLRKSGPARALSPNHRPVLRIVGSGDENALSHVFCLPTSSCLCLQCRLSKRIGKEFAIKDLSWLRFLCREEPNESFMQQHSSSVVRWLEERRARNEVWTMSFYKNLIGQGIT